MSGGKNVPEKVTLRVIADKVGVSVSVVSRVLRNKRKKVSITEKTKRRILETAAEYGFSLNDNIGVLISDRFLHYDLIHYPFLAGVFARANELGHGIFSAFFGDDTSNDSAIPAFIEERNVRGVVALGSPPEHLSSFLDDNIIPYVLADVGGEPRAENCVSIDYRGTTLALLECLRDLGYTEYTMLSNNSEEPAPFERMEFDEFKSFVDKNSFKGEIFFQKGSLDEYLRILSAKIDDRGGGTVYIAESRMLTVELLKLFALKGLTPQRDVGLVGNNLLSRHCHPPFISVKYDFHQMGVDSVSMMHEIVRNRNSPVPTQIVKGDILR